MSPLQVSTLRNAMLSMEIVAEDKINPDFKAMLEREIKALKEEFKEELKECR